MKQFNTNFFLTNHALGAGEHYTTPIEGWGLKKVKFLINIDGVNGIPDNAKIDAVFQVSPMEYGGYNLDWQPAGNQRVWADVSSEDLSYLCGSNFSSPLATHENTSRIIIREMNLGCAILVRLKLTATFAGGENPSFNVSVSSTDEY